MSGKCLSQNNNNKHAQTVECRHPQGDEFNAKNNVFKNLLCCSKPQSSFLAFSLQCKSQSFFCLLSRGEGTRQAHKANRGVQAFSLHFAKVKLRHILCVFSNWEKYQRKTQEQACTNLFRKKQNVACHNRIIQKEGAGEVQERTK